MNSKENFEIKTTFKDKDGKIIKFIKKVDLEVNWKEKKTEMPQEVVFKKDGKEYQIIIKELKIRKGWLKKQIVSTSLGLPPDISYNTYHGEPSSDGKGKSSSNNEEDDYFYIKFVNPWRKEVIITLLIIFIAFIIGIFLQVRKKEKNK